MFSKSKLLYTRRLIKLFHTDSNNVIKTKIDFKSQQFIVIRITVQIRF
jgi:hypothetical protein